MFTQLGRAWMFAAMVLLAVLCSGCLRGNVEEFLSYDPATDTFKLLQLDLNVIADETRDRDHLVELWNECDQVITRPYALRQFGMPEFLRVDASHFLEIDLSQPISDKAKPPASTSIPLDKISIQPGKFFLSPGNTLCYYHQIAVAGTVVDEVLVAQNKLLCQRMKQDVDNELKRRSDGGRPRSWDDIRQEMSQHFDQEKPENSAPKSADRPAGAPDKSPPEKAEGWPLDNVSLDLLRKAAAAGEIGVRRRGAEFSVELRLSPDDCQQAKTTVDLYWDKTVGRAQAIAGSGDVIDILPELRTENAGGGRLIIKIEMKPFIRLTGRSDPTRLRALATPVWVWPFVCLTGTSYTAAKPIPELTERYRKTIAAVRNHGIPIDEKLTVKQILEEFAAKH